MQWPIQVGCRLLLAKKKYVTGKYRLNLEHFVENTPTIAPNPCFVIMDLNKIEKKCVVSEIYGNHSNEVNPPLKL